MEFDEDKIKPESNRKFLQQQVEEQSDVCDVTVKIGRWERKYHKCVLMASPFFECILRNDFLEKHSGEVNLNCGSPSNTDMALMYLYGKKPTLNDANIEVMIDLAEFFLIPNLKSACFSWLKRQNITDENCLSLIQLSSKYGFELPKCTEYLESHLNVVLLQSLSLNLTFETIEYIFTEKKLCYFQMEDRLRYLVRWYEAQPEKRKQWVKPLIVHIAFEDISVSCLNDIRSCDRIRDILPDVNVDLQLPDEPADVLISKRYGSFLCYDLAKDTWFELHADATPDRQHSITIVDTNPGLSEVLMKSDYGNSKLYTLSFETNENETYEVVTSTGDPVPTGTCSDFRYNLCVICKSERVRTNYPEQDHVASIERLRLLSLFGPVGGFAMNEFLSPRGFITYRASTSVLIGKISGDQVRMDPLFSISGSEISKVSANNDSLVALIPDTRTSLLIYDTVDCTLDTLEMKTEYSDKIFPAGNGFILHKNKSYISIKRLVGPSLAQRYQVKEYELGGKPDGWVRYFYCNDTWFRYFRDSYDTGYRFQSVKQSHLEEAYSSDTLTVEWKKLSLPKESSACSNSTLGETMHFIRLPRRLLRCHVDCPHCKAENQRSSVVRRSAYNDDDDEYYDDDSDDCYDDSDDYTGYMYGGGMYDSDDYYYGSD